VVVVLSKWYIKTFVNSSLAKSSCASGGKTIREGLWATSVKATAGLEEFCENC
jgi:hypothetical protein